MAPSARTLQEVRTTLAPGDVLARAKSFFSRHSPLYGTFIDKEGPTFATFRGQGTEEIVIGVSPAEQGGTLVRGSTYLYDFVVARFFTTLPPWRDAEPQPNAGAGAAAAATPAGGAA